MSFPSVEEKNAVRAMFVWLNCSIFGNWNVASVVMENLRPGCSRERAPGTGN